MFDKFGKDLPSRGRRPRPSRIRSGWGPGAFWLAAAAAALASASQAAETSPPEAADPGSWLGHWYVLVHYREEAEGSPEEMQWDDEIWRIEVEGSGLRWTIFPHPEFRDSSGRWQTWPSGEEGRSPGAWEPTPGQLEEIAEGLAHGGQDEQSKRLRSDRGGHWASVGGRRASSASQIGYVERWRIQAAPPGPIFEREAAMGSGRTLGIQAITRFLTRETLAGERELRGDYARQGERRGTFRLLRMGAPEGQAP